MEQIRLDLIPNGIMPNVHASQFDKSRTVRFNLYEGDTPFTLLATDNVKVACNGVEDSTLATAGTSHEWTIPDSVVSDSGIFIGELSVERGSKTIGSKNFVLNVEEDAYNGKNLEERTASGSIANFETNLQDNLTACKCTINPLQSGTGTPSPSNPRPISGFSGANIVRCGKNLLDSSVLLDQVAWHTFVLLKGKPNTAYTISSNLPSAKTSELACYVFNSTGNPSASNLVYSGQAITVTTNADGIVKCQQRRISGTDSFANYEWQLEQGTPATTYKPYNGSQYAPYFEGLLNGTYGFVDLGSLNWQKNGTNRFTSIDQPNNIKAPSSQSEYAKIACPNYKTSNFTTVYSESTDKIVAINTNKAINIIDKAYTDATAFKNSLDGVYLIYELATPTTPTITQSQIDTLIRAFGDTCVCVVFGQTVYGGVLDVTNGKLRITHKGETFTSVVNGGASSTASWWGQLIASGAKRAPNNNTKMDVIADYLETVTAGQVINTENDCIGVNTNGAINIKIQGMTSLADYNTYLSSNPLTVVYELATPTEITLTPKQIEALVGINNVYHDCNGETEVKYLVEV